MKTLQLILTTLILALAPGLNAAEIEPFTAHYDLRFSGLSGESVMTLSEADDGSYVLENRTRATGLARLLRPRDAVDRSEFVIDNDQFRPALFVSEDGTRKNKRGSRIAFDWASGNATTIYKEETQSQDLKTGMLDRQLLQLAMMSDLSKGKTESSYTVIDRHDLKTYTISVVAEEEIEVPAGNFSVVKIHRAREGSSRTSIMWCAPALGYLTVKMEQLKDGDVIGTLMLSEIS